MFEVGVHSFDLIITDYELRSPTVFSLLSAILDSSLSCFRKSFRDFKFSLPRVSGSMLPTCQMASS